MAQQSLAARSAPLRNEPHSGMVRVVSGQRQAADQLMTGQSLADQHLFGGLSVKGLTSWVAYLQKY